MTVIAPVRAGVSPDPKFGEMLTVTWTMATGDTATAIALPEFASRSVTVTFSAGTGTITIEGSNDGTNFAGLTDPQGTAISKTSGTTVEEILESTVWIKPVLTGGAGATVIITLFLRRGRR